MEVLQGVWGAIVDILQNSGYAYFFSSGGFLNLIMILVSFFLLWLGIKKGFEPLLMIPIAFGMLLANIPGANLFHSELFISIDPNFEFSITEVIKKGRSLCYDLFLGNR